MNYTDLLKLIWNSLYDPKNDTTKIIEKFFHPEYKQCINGVCMNRNEYIHHIQEQKKNLIIDTIDYKHVLETGNELFALYYPKGRNNENHPLEAEVIAYFRFENQQVLRINGQVRLIKGDYADVDIKNF